MASPKRKPALILLLAAMSWSGAAAHAFSGNSALRIAGETIDGASNKEDEKKLAEAERKRAEAETEISKLQALKLTAESAKRLLSARTKELESIRDLYQEMHDLIQLELTDGFGGKSRKEADERLRNIRLELRCRERGMEWTNPDTCTESSQSSIVKEMPKQTGAAKTDSAPPVKPDATTPTIPDTPKPAVSPLRSSLTELPEAPRVKDIVYSLRTDSPPREVVSGPSVARAGMTAEPTGMPLLQPRAAESTATTPSIGGPPAKAMTTSAPPPPVTAGTLRGEIRSPHGNPLKGVTVRLKCDSGGDVPSTRTDQNGIFQWENIPAGTCAVSTSGLGWEDTELRGLSIPSEGKQLDPIYLDERNAGVGELARAIVGFEQSGASASPSAQKYFTDIFVSIPRPWRSKSTYDPNFGPHLRIWGDIRVTSVPQQVQSTLGQFAVSFQQNISNVKVNELAQAFEYLVGPEVRLRGWSARPPFSFDHETRNKFTVSFVMAGGYSTPLTPRQSLQIFKVPAPGAEDNFFTQPETKTINFAGKDFVAFATRDRNRFFREYYGGFRFKDFYYDRTGNPINRFPAMFDFVVGQNEAVTGGRFHGVVLRLDAFYPLPFESAKYIYLFGTAHLKPARTIIKDAILLEDAPAGTVVPAPNVVIISVPQIDRDFYRIGVGIDAISLFQYIKDKNKEKPAP